MMVLIMTAVMSAPCTVPPPLGAQPVGQMLLSPAGPDRTALWPLKSPTDARPPSDCMKRSCTLLRPASKPLWNVVMYLRASPQWRAQAGRGPQRDHTPQPPAGAASCRAPAAAPADGTQPRSPTAGINRRAPARDGAEGGGGGAGGTLGCVG